MGKPNVDVIVGASLEKSATYGSRAVKAGIPFASQVTEPDMKYIIKYDFDLKGATVEMPGNCILEFDGGSISNGTVVFNDTYIKDANKSFKDIVAQGTVTNNFIEARWFYIYGDATSAYKSMVELGNNSNKPLFFNKGVYDFKDDIRNIVCKQSIDFDNSVVNLYSNLEENYFNIQNSGPVDITDTSVLTSIGSLVNTGNTNTSVLGIKDCLLSVSSNDVEIMREHRLVHTPMNKSEFIYIDKDGYTINRWFNNEINVTSAYTIPCDVSTYIKNVILNIVDNYTGPATLEYRYLGFSIDYSANITVSNILFNCDIQDYRCVYFKARHCYNLVYENINSNNTRLDSSVQIKGDTSAYVFNFGRIVSLKMDSVFIGGAGSNAWATMGGNYLTDVVINRCVMGNVDTHYRLYNLSVTDSALYYIGITYTGKGTINLRGCRFINCIAPIRANRSYGAFFDGDINVEDCEVIYDGTAEYYFTTQTFSSFDFQEGFEGFNYKIARNLNISNLKVTTAGVFSIVRLYQGTIGALVTDPEDENYGKIVVKQDGVVISVSNVGTGKLILPNVSVDKCNAKCTQFQAIRCGYNILVNLDKSKDLRIDLKNVVGNTSNLAGIRFLDTTDDVLIYENSDNLCMTKINIENCTSINGYDIYSKAYSYYRNCVVNAPIWSRYNNSVIKYDFCEIKPTSDTRPASNSPVVFSNCTFYPRIYTSGGVVTYSTSFYGISNSIFFATAPNIQCVECVTSREFRENNDIGVFVSGAKSTEIQNYPLVESSVGGDAITLNPRVRTILLSNNGIVSTTGTIKVNIDSLNFTPFAITIVMLQLQGLTLRLEKDDGTLVDQKTITYARESVLVTQHYKVNTPSYRVTWGEAKKSGTRPTVAQTGDYYFDSTSNKPLWYNGTNWVDATGTTV